MTGPASSTVLHETDEDKDSLKIYVAARSGKEEKVLQILDRRPELIYHRNKIGDNPLHVAAKAGHLGMVELLIAFFQSRYSSQSSGSSGSTENRAEEIPSATIEVDRITNSDQLPQSSDQSESRARNTVLIIEPIWKTKNRDGSTALHEALRNKHEDIALYLLDVDSEPVEFANHKEESPLYLAAKAGYVRVLNNILETGRNPSTVGPKGQTPFHAAVFAKSQESIRILYGSIPRLIQEQDSNGKTALYHATQEDSLEMMCLLLELDPYSACICDNKKLSPLLVAVKKGRSASVQAILDACPVSEIHVLVNKCDLEGNTPLHLATKEQKYQHVRALLSSKHVDLTATNNRGQTALDLCPSGRNLSHQQEMIRDALNEASRGGSKWVAILVCIICCVGTGFICWDVLRLKMKSRARIH